MTQIVGPNYLKLKDWFNYKENQAVKIYPTIIQLGISTPFTSIIKYYPMVVDCISSAIWNTHKKVLAFGQVYYEDESIQLEPVYDCIKYTCHELDYTDDTEIKKLLEATKTSKIFYLS